MVNSLSFVALLSVLGFAAPPQIMIQPDSRVWVEGGSTVRDWSCAAAEVGGTVAPGPGAAALRVDDLGAAVASVELRIPVARLDCGNGTMDGHLRKTLRASEHETIVFRMQSYSSSAAVEGVSTLELRGTLTIAGAERPVVIKADAMRESDGTLRVQGSHPIRMSQWGVKPPSLMLGTMKVRDDVVVHFDMKLRQQ